MSNNLPKISAHQVIKRSTIKDSRFNNSRKLRKVFFAKQKPHTQTNRFSEYFESIKEQERSAGRAGRGVHPDRHGMVDRGRHILKHKSPEKDYERYKKAAA